jgi:hypothetical protein
MKALTERTKKSIRSDTIGYLTVSSAMFMQNMERSRR